MYRLKSVEGTNFLSFESFHVDFTLGLYLISGYNERGGGSNESGKSALLSAIPYALFGRTSKGATSEIIMWGSENMSVRLVLTESSTEYVITRTQSTLSFSIDNEPQKGNKTDLQNLINTAFKTDYFSFMNFNMFSHGQFEFFAVAGDVEKKKILKKITELELIDKAYDRVKFLFDSKMKEATELDIQVGYLTGRFQDEEIALGEYKSGKVSFDKKREEEIKSLQKQIDTTKSPNAGYLTSLTRELKDIEISLSKINVPKEEETQLTQQANAITFEVGSASTHISEIGNVLLGLENLKGVCKHCGSPVARKNVAAYRISLETQLESWNDRLKQLKLNHDQTETKRKQLSDLAMQHETLSQKYVETQLQIKTSKQLIEQEEASIKFIEEKIKQARGAPNPYFELVTKSENTLSNLNGEIATKKCELLNLQKEIDICSFLKWTFSREGVSAHIVERTFGRLESLANLYLSKLSSENFILEIVPQRELKSKAYKEEIEIRVQYDGRWVSYWNLSDGRRQRINLALLAALNRLCRDVGISAFDFMLLDEILDLSLDSKGQDDVSRFLRELSHELRTIVVISHKEDLSSGEWDHKINVRRDINGVSHV